MNANELADKLEQGHWEGGTREQAATMLRQQQAEYYSLLVNHDKLYAKVVEQQAEIEALKSKTLTDEEDTECQYCKQGCIRCDARKTLTDEEIYEVWCDAIKEEAIVNKGKPPILKYQPFVFFARAILRKAQENAPNNL